MHGHTIKLISFFIWLDGIFYSIQISVPEEERIDTGAIYRQMSLAELQKKVPQFEWTKYFSVVLTNVPFDQSERIVSYSMPYFELLGDLLAQVDQR